MTFRLGFHVEGVEASSKAFADFGKAITDRLNRILTETGQHVVGVAREDYLSGPRPEKLGRRTGNLASLQDFRILGNEVAIGNNVPYGRLWEKGGTIPARTIFPKHGKFLVFQVGGETVFARMVRQKARRVDPRPYLAPALRDSVTKIRDIAQFWASDAAKEAFAGG